MISFILEKFLPHLKTRGVTDEQVNTIMVENEPYCEMSKVYNGARNRESPSPGVEVRVVEDGASRYLPLRFDLKEHSPEGFEWGYGNKGPSQLALAILADVTGSDDYALRHHIWFKLEIVSRLPWKGWELTEQQVWRWINEHHPLGKNQ